MDMFRPGPIPNQYINQLIKKKGMLPSKSHIKRIYRDNGNPKSTDLAKAFKQLSKEKYIKKQGSLWKWESGFAWESVNERISVSDERHFGKKVSAIFNDKKNANKFNRNKPADIKKLLQLAKKTKYPKAIDESVNEGKKRYYQQDRVGSAKYTISYHDGKKKHKDGSDFFDIKIFRNKKDLAKFVNTLSKSGYVYGFNESVNEGSLDWEKNFKWANEKELKVIAKVVHMSNGIAPVIKMSKKKDFKPFIKKAAQKGLGESINETLPNRVWMDLRKKYSTNELKRFFKKESVNERKNPKREKAKKNFSKYLKSMEKEIRGIKSFAKANQWGAISSFVDDGLVKDMKLLQKEIDTIIKLPIDESVNEAIEQETNIPFEMIGKSYISIKGRKLTAKLQFKGNDLQDVVNGKKKKGKVVLASITTK